MNIETCLNCYHTPKNNPNKRHCVKAKQGARTCNEFYRSYTQCERYKEYKRRNK